MIEPDITEGFSCLEYFWEPEGLLVRLDRYNDEGKAEITVRHKNGEKMALWHQASTNLMSTTTKNSLKKTLEARSGDIDWDFVLTYITGKTLQIARQGEPVMELFPTDADSLEVEYLCYPVLYKNHPTVMFAEGDSGKSITALVISYIVQLPLFDNGLGLVPRKESTKVLYLDWEDDHTSFIKRWGGINRGFGDMVMPILYRHMQGPLCDHVEFLKRYIDDNEIGLIICDSLGTASGGNLNDPEPAIKYNAALRALGVTSLTIAHTSKGLDKNKTIYGSVYFRNLARSVFQCDAEHDVSGDGITIGLKHDKANLSRRCNAFGLHYQWEGEKILVSPASLDETSLSDNLPAPVRIEKLLAYKPLSVKEIAEELDIPEGTARKTCERMVKRGILIKMGNQWGLLTKEEVN